MVTSWMQPALKPQILYTTALDSPGDINRQIGVFKQPPNHRDFTKSIEPMGLEVLLVFINAW